MFYLFQVKLDSIVYMYLEQGGHKMPRTHRQTAMRAESQDVD